MTFTKLGGLSTARRCPQVEEPGRHWGRVRDDREEYCQVYAGAAVGGTFEGAAGQGDAAFSGGGGSVLSVGEGAEGGVRAGGEGEDKAGCEDGEVRQGHGRKCDGEEGAGGTWRRKREEGFCRKAHQAAGGCVREVLCRCEACGCGWDCGGSAGGMVRERGSG